MANSFIYKNQIINVGDTIAVYHKVKEGNKERIQIFKGTVIAIKNHGEGKSFTVRKIAVNQIGVERIWPLLCPSIKEIKIIDKGNVRRAKLYYLRKKTGKEFLKLRGSKENGSKKANSNLQKGIGKTR